MKLIILLSILNINLSYHNRAKSNAGKNQSKLHKMTIKSPKVKTNIKNTTIIQNVDNKKTKENAHFEYDIEVAISKTFNQKNINYIDDELSEIQKDKNIPDTWKIYWTTYLYYYKAIFFKSIDKDDKNASITIDKALQTIEKALNSSEDYALYAACLSYSIQFANMTRLAGISSKVNENAQKALELNGKNMRAYYVLASHNLYTPKMFGGMTKVESYATKGLTCPQQFGKR